MKERSDRRRVDLDLNVDGESPSDGVLGQPPFINQRRNERPFSVIPAYYSASTGAAWGIMTTVVTRLKPAIRSGSTLPAAARLHV